MKIQHTKAVFSIKEICEILQLSRARYYQLLQAGMLPQPLYDIHTKRPFYNLELQAQCRQVKETCVGMNGQYILFYTPRKKLQSNAGKALKKNGTFHQEIIDILFEMGLDVSGKDVESAMKTVFPQGIQDGQDPTLIAREIFRYFKRNSI